MDYSQFLLMKEELSLIAVIVDVYKRQVEEKKKPAAPQPEAAKQSVIHN